MARNAQPGSAGLVLVGNHAGRAHPCRVSSGPAYVAIAEHLLGELPLIELDEPILDNAAKLPPKTLRTLDAIHVATALTVANDLVAFVAYDDRLLDAARDAGLPAAAPGRPLV